MSTITAAQAASLQDELDALNPPAQVSRAAKVILALAAAGAQVPRDLIQYVQSWITRRGAQNRYGK